MHLSYLPGPKGDHIELVYSSRVSPCHVRDVDDDGRIFTGQPDIVAWWRALAGITGTDESLKVQSNAPDAEHLVCQSSDVLLLNTYFVLDEVLIIVALMYHLLFFPTYTNLI